MLDATDKSFLLLFFKKEELLPSWMLAVAALGGALGFVLALALWRGPALARWLALVCAVLILLIQAPNLNGLPGNAVLFVCATARTAAVVLLILLPPLQRVPAGLGTAARAAGAAPWRAWRHAVLAPIAWPLVLAAAAALGAGFLQSPVREPLTIPKIFAQAWLLPATVLLAVAGLTALFALLRRPPA